FLLPISTFLVHCNNELELCCTKVKKLKSSLATKLQTIFIFRHLNRSKWLGHCLTFMRKTYANLQKNLPILSIINSLLSVYGKTVKTVITLKAFGLMTITFCSPEII